MSDEQHINNLLKASVASFRSYINRGLGALGIGVSAGSASLLSLVIILFLGFNLFLYLNIALGFFLGEMSGGSLTQGFLWLSALYALLIASYLLIRRRIETRVRNRIARQVIHLEDNINAQLDTVEPLQVDEGYREAYISGEPEPYRALELRRTEAAHQAKHAGKEVKREVEYIRTHYGSIVMNAAESHIEQRYPAYRFLMPLVGLFRQPATKRPNTFGQAAAAHQASQPGRLTEMIDRARPFLPYLNLAYTILKPVVTTLIIGKTQGWLLGLLGLGRKRKGRR